MDMFDNEPVDFSDLDQCDVPAKPVDHDPIGSSTNDASDKPNISIKWVWNKLHMYDIVMHFTKYVQLRPFDSMQFLLCHPMKTIIKIGAN